MKSLNKNDKRQLKKEILNLLSNTTVKANRLDFVEVKSVDGRFSLIGCGCSSAVFRSESYPFIVVKIYSPSHLEEVLMETIAYKKVKGIDYFPRLYLYGPNFLAIEYVEGESLYDCLIKGIEIPEETIDQVDCAILLAKERGLCPSDVHFKNIILHEGRIKLIDLSDYMAAEHITRWDRLKFFYRTVYKPLLKGYKVPKPVVDILRKSYKIAERAFKIVLRE